jgi:hypothetical protein
VNAIPPERKAAMVKEWLLLIAGLAGIGYQLITDNVNIVLLIVFTAMAGVPGLANLISLFRNSSTVLQSVSSPQESAELESGNSLPSSSEDRA